MNTTYRKRLLFLFPSVLAAALATFLLLSLLSSPSTVATGPVRSDAVLSNLNTQFTGNSTGGVPTKKIVAKEIGPLSTLATCIVTSPADSGPGTLRQCLLGAQPNDTITFDPNAFPLTNPVAITVTSGPLPTIIADGLNIDANGAGVILDGHALTDTHGLYIRADNVTVRYLQIVNFDWSGIRIYTDSNNAIIEGNIISGNHNDGVRIRGSSITGTHILSNIISGNNFCGVRLDGAQDNVVGPGNRITHNSQDGIRVEGADTLRNTITQNSITANDDLAINNVDGGNGELTPPTITNVSGTTILGQAQPGATIEIFIDPFFEGERFVVSATADASGSFLAALTTPLTGHLVTATSTDLAGNTSQFAAFCRLEGLGSPDIIWPYCTTEPSPISSGFGPRQMASQGFRYDFHRGVDLPAPLETPFFAVADGVVTRVVTDPIGLDGTIRIKHTGPVTYYSHYRHVAHSFVITGQDVHKGMVIGLTGHSYSKFPHTHFEVRNEPGGYERYSVNPFGRMPYVDTNDYEIEISQVSVDPTNPMGPTTVLVKVKGPRQELDLNRFTVLVTNNERALDLNNLNRTKTPAPNDDEPDVLDNPYQNGICIMPDRFNTSSDAYRLTLAFNQLPNDLPGNILAQAADLSSNAVTTTLHASGELLLSPAVVTATTPAGRWVTHTHKLTNASSTTQTFTLTAKSAQSWIANVEPTTVALPPGESVTFTTSISVPIRDWVMTGTTDCIVVEVFPSGCSLTDVTISGDDTILAGQVLTLASWVTPTATADSVTYTWSEGNLVSSINDTATYYWSETGVYTIVVTATNQCRSVTDTHTVTVGPTVDFSSAIYSVHESDVTATITVALDAPPVLTATVDYSTSDGTATPGEDYITASGTLTFTPGVITKTFPVTIADDIVYEGDETINLKLRDPISATIGDNDTAILTIVDDEIAIFLPIVLKNNPSLKFEYEVQGCLTSTMSTDELVEIFVEGNDVVMHHYNATYNCCAVIVVDLIDERPLLKLIERETYPGGVPCFCLCPYEISARIPDLPSGSYQVEVWNWNQSHLYGSAEVVVP